MVDMSVSILLVVSFSMASAVVTYAITKKRYYTKGKKDGITEYKSDLFRENDVETIINERIDKYKKSNDYLSALNLCTKSGEMEGAKNELAKFNIEYTPFINTKDEFLKKRAESGYLMQLFYSGLPIGEATKRVTVVEEKYKEENAKYLIESVTKTIDNICKVATTNNIPIQISPNVQRGKL